MIANRIGTTDMDFNNMNKMPLIKSVDWNNFTTITTFDSGSVDGDGCESTEMIQNNDISLRPPVTTPVSILVQSLIKQLCILSETDHDRAIKLYKTICEKLHQMKLLDETYAKKEFEDLRYQYQSAFNQLVKKTNDTEVPFNIQNFWPIPTMFERSWSRYHREFDEISFIAKGGFGKVFKVKNRLDEVQYAVKKVAIQAKDIDSMSKHLAEVKTFASLTHPNIVPYKSAWLEPIFNFSNGNEIEDLRDTDFDNPSSNSFDESSEYLSKHDTKDSTKFQIYFAKSTSNDKSNCSIFDSKESIAECKALCRISDRQNVNYFESPALQLQWATLYIQMSLREKTLKTWLEERNIEKLNINQCCKLNSPRTKMVLDIFKQLVEGVNYIHSREIVHHDIKPTNIFIGEEYGGVNIQLADFGLACPRRTSHNGVGFGTLLYAAPEQLEGVCDPKNDLYSIGFILLELIESFGTNMEKAKTFKLLREGSIPVHVTIHYPKLAQMIRKLAENDIQTRINTTDLLIMLKALYNNKDETIKALQEEIIMKDEEIARLKNLLAINKISH